MNRLDDVKAEMPYIFLPARYPASDTSTTVFPAGIPNQDSLNTSRSPLQDTDDADASDAASAEKSKKTRTQRNVLFPNPLKVTYLLVVDCFSNNY